MFETEDPRPPPKKHGRHQEKVPTALLEARGSFKKSPKLLKTHPDYVPPKDRKEASKKLRMRDYVGIARRYAEDVVENRIVACLWTRLACQRHLDDLSKQNDPMFPYRFDVAKANVFCARMERFPHIKGRWALKGERLRLEPWQCFATVVPFGWMRKRDGLRRFRKIYLQVPRKNAKSTWAAAVGNVMLLDDGEHGAEVYSGATTEKQAWEVFGPARMMIERSKPIQEEYGIEVMAKSLVCLADNSKFAPIIGKPGDGASPSCSIHDEYHEHDTSDQLDSMQTGMGAREQPMMIIITTAGTNLAGPCYDEFLSAKKILQGTIDDAETFVLIYGIDEPIGTDKGDDWADPKILAKANPNMNVSVSEEYLLSQLREAVANPAKQNRFKTKHLNVWCTSSVAGINMHLWRRAADPNLRPEQFLGEEAFFALDLASKIDICSFIKIFPKVVDGARHYYCFARNYIPEETVEETTYNQGAYRKWVAAGRLIATPGAEIDFDSLKDEVVEDAGKYQAREIVYDPWRATQLAHQLQKEGAAVVEMGQTAKNMGEAFDEFLSALKGGRFHHDGDPVMEWMASNVMAKSVAKGLVVPAKEKREQKIDGIVAAVMAIARAMASDPDGGFDDFIRSPVLAGG